MCFHEHGRFAFMVHTLKIHEGTAVCVYAHTQDYVCVRLPEDYFTN